MNIKAVTKKYIVQCLSCKLIHRLSADGFEFDEVSSNERAMGPEICHEAEMDITCDCGQNFSVKAECWEYPVGSLNHVEISVSNCVLVVDPEFDYIHEKPQDEGDE